MEVRGRSTKVELLGDGSVCRVAFSASIDVSFDFIGAGDGVQICKLSSRGGDGTQRSCRVLQIAVS